MSNIPKMRTAPEAIEEIKKIDPDTSLTLRALRRMMNNGEIPVVYVNTRRLINLDILFDYLYNPDSTAASSAKVGKIHRIS